MGNEAQIVIGSREQLFHLLAEAAAIEHTLTPEPDDKVISSIVRDPAALPLASVR